MHIFFIIKYEFWLNGTSFPYSDGTGAFITQKLGKRDLFAKKWIFEIQNVKVSILRPQGQ